MLKKTTSATRDESLHCGVKTIQCVGFNRKKVWPAKEGTSNAESKLRDSLSLVKKEFSGINLHEKKIF
uniref:Uncharacterized protein n=2 Tax=Meloidogyne TaxID=189290 RepID=A0A6V7WX64_MELEN|nr:unnamed protein product [Meloidogyne enterolobii]